MLDYNFKMSSFRQDEITGEKQKIYENVACDVQINQYKRYANGQNSDNSEIADFFIFTKKENNDLEVGDLIEFENNFGKRILAKIQSMDYINFESIEPFIEILAKLK